MSISRKPPVKQSNQSILVKNDRLKHFYAPHHYHQDYEIIYIKKSRGIRVVGNNIDNYESGEVVILGPRLPHYHVVGEVDEADDYPIETIAVLFPQALVENNKSFPEFEQLSPVLEDIHYGIELLGECRTEVQGILETMSLEPSYQNYLALFQIFFALGNAPQSYRKLSTIEYQQTRLSDERLRRALDYVSQHFQHAINVKEASKVAGMSLSGFSVHFKTQTGYTFSQYLNSLRVNKAAELLAISRKGIAEIAYEVGYDNLAYFNRKFKEIKGKTPRELQKELNELKKG